MIRIIIGTIGFYTVVLGAIHFFLPYLLDFDRAIPKLGPALKPFRLLGFSYKTTRDDIRGIAWVMNHSVSYALVTIGIVDLVWPFWRNASFATAVYLWVALWWIIRAFSQLYLGKRRGDWLILAWFLLLGVFHAYLAIR